MEKIAIIPARGGSKRIPRKNIKDFCGMPIISYSIKAAIESGLFNEVMVSTDDEQIAEVARKYGANVPFLRSKKNADDYATTADVLEEVLREYRVQGSFFAWMCCIYPTAPFITAEKLESAFKLLVQKNANAVIPVVQFSFPPQRCFIIKKGSIVFKWPEYALKRSQDLEPFYHDAGQYYFLKTSMFEKCKMLVPENTIPIFCNEIDVQDIDNLEDWEVAEFKYKMKRRLL